MRGTWRLLGLFIAGLSLIAGAGEAKAWGKFGHLTVCDLAYRNLTDTSRTALKHLFRAGRGGIWVEGRGKLADRSYSSFNVGCLEEDALPRRHESDHFVNVPRTTGAIDGNVCPGDGSCTFAGIERDVEILADTSKSDEERVFALMALGHWIGDIHQPLHISFADDRGGNRIDVKLTGKCGSSSYPVKNLHGVWDNCLLEAGLFERVRRRADFKRSWSKNTITYRAVDTLLANTSLTDEKLMIGSQPAEWANESFQITVAEATLYCVKRDESCRYADQHETLGPGVPRRNMALGQDYLAAHERLAEKRVQLAGFRLAHLINGALDPTYTEPVQNTSQLP